MYTILSINPGSGSTKIGLYREGNLLFGETIEHPLEKLSEFKEIEDQSDFRFEVILEKIREKKINLSEIDAVVGRGGLLSPVKSGAYEINDALLDYLKNRPRIHHASNLGAPIAKKIAAICGDKVRAFIYDSVTVDEYDELSRISGLNGIERESIGHTLNMRAAAIRVAEMMNKNYVETNIIVAHLGGGNSISIHKKGRMIDSISDDEGPFSTERTGGIPLKSIIKLCYENPQEEVMALYRKKGGLISYFGTNDAREVQKMIEAGDKRALTVYRALGYQVAKGIGSLATVVEGSVDAVVLTGGLAHSNFLMDEIEKRITFIAPVYRLPGENELKALSEGVVRVLEGKEKSHEFVE